MKTTGMLEPAVTRTSSRMARQDAFAVIVSDIADSLAIHNVMLGSERNRNLRALVDAYTESMRTIHRFHDGLRMTIEGAVESYVWLGHGEKRAELYQERMKEAFALLAKEPLRIQDVMVAEILAGDETESLAALTDGLRNTVFDMLSDFQSVCSGLQANRVFGEIAWFAQDVCRYDFYRTSRHRSVTSEKKDAQRERQEDVQKNQVIEYDVETLTKDFEIADVLEHHEHHLYNAVRHQLPAPQVRKPAFVREFLRKIPTWLHPHVFIVEGDMLREGIEKEISPVRTEQSVSEVSRTVVRIGNLYSPAVTIGDVVLTGWSGSDL